MRSTWGQWPEWTCASLSSTRHPLCNLLLDSGAALDGAAFEIAMSVYLLLHLMFATVISTLYPVSFDEHGIILFMFLKFRAIFQVRITERNVKKKGNNWLIFRSIYCQHTPIDGVCGARSKVFWGQSDSGKRSAVKIFKSWSGGRGRNFGLVKDLQTHTIRLMCIFDWEINWQSFGILLN